jgi:hypothetical protein
MRSKRLDAGALRFWPDATNQPKAQFHDQFQFFSKATYSPLVGCAAIRHPLVSAQLRRPIYSLSNAERKLFRVRQIGRRESGQRNAEQADTLCHRELPPEQIQGDALQRGALVHCPQQRPAARDLLEIGIFDFQSHGATAGFGALAVTPDLLDDT